MTPNQRRDLAKITQFTVIWILGGILYGLLEYGILGDSKIYPSTKNLYQFETSMLSAILNSITLGLLIGTIETKIVNYYFETRTFWQKITYKTLLYVTLIIALLLISTLKVSSSRLEVSMFHPKAVEAIEQFVSNFSFWSIMIFAGTITVLALFIAEVSDYLGGGVFNNFFTGKYHQPIEEERIFMFLDMNSSTTIAEKLGHKEYFQLLKKYYSDLTAAIIETGGEVYQYAGDEIIVSWNLKKGLANNNCIDCFFLINETFKTSSNTYLNRFGLVPKYKAGFHYGKVTTGEIGILKKELFFTGDVLNTTARIQSTCGQYKTDNLISNELLALLDLNNTYKIIPIGECKLKGRNEKIDLFTLKYNFANEAII
jgi:adenylate cyclase